MPLLALLLLVPSHAFARGETASEITYGIVVYRESRWSSLGKWPIRR